MSTGSAEPVMPSQDDTKAVRNPKPDLPAVREIIDQLAALGVPDAALRPILDWVRDREDGKPQTAIYFGTWSQAGHYYWTPNGGHPKGEDGRSDSLRYKTPFSPVDGNYTPKCHTKQSTAAIHYRDGWTILAFHDYTVDQRPGSNGAFIFDTELSFERAVAEASERFPTIMRRVVALALHTCDEQTPRIPSSTLKAG